MRFLLGIDDTDAMESIGTGALARELAGFLAREHNATPAAITRHQLLVHPDIPYTSHNSSACLAFDCDLDRRALADACRRFVSFLFHPGADPGVCVARPEEAALAPVVAFGRRAQGEIVGREEAHAIAKQLGLELLELGGTGLGVIGALAAVGLRASGDDGRFISLPGARSLRGTLSAGDIKRAVAIDRVVDPAGSEVPDGCAIETSGWIRPDLRGGRVVLLVKEDQGRYAVVRPKHGNDDQ